MKHSALGNKDEKHCCNGCCGNIGWYTVNDFPMFHEHILVFPSGFFQCFTSEKCNIEIQKIISHKNLLPTWKERERERRKWGSEWVSEKKNQKTTTYIKSTYSNYNLIWIHSLLGSHIRIFSYHHVHAWELLLEW